MALTAIRTERLSRRYGSVDAVRDVTLEIPRGEIFGLVGPDGAGKTTLIQMLCGILTPSAGRGTVLDFDIVRDAAEIGERVGYMSQAFTLYGSLSVGENIEFFADIHGVPQDRRRHRTGELLRFSRLAPFVQRLARHLSGGMQKKLALSTSLIHDPEILFLDEPTTGVDPISRREFWQLIAEFLREGVTVVVATPYMDEAERCQRVALMHEGRILAIDSPEALKADLGGQMAEFWTTRQADALAALRGDPEVRDAQIFGRSIHALMDEMASYRRVERRLGEAGIDVQSARCIDPGLEDVFTARLGPGSPRQGDLAAFPRVDPAGIEIAGLSRRFGDFVAVDNVSFTVEPGDVFGFLGPNGSGKSTTIRMLMGVLRPSGGTARIGGIDIVREGRAVRPMLGYMSQKFSLYDDLTVAENLDLFAGAYGVPRSERASRRAWALDVVQFRGRESLRVETLSGGWKQRLALAAAIVHRPRVVLLDEPTSGVDPLSRRLFWDLIFGLAESGVTVLVTTHYMDEAERCSRLALLSAGRLLAVGATDELRAAVGGHVLTLRVDHPIAALRVVQALPAVRQCTLRGSRLDVLVDAGGEGLLRTQLADAGLTAVDIEPARVSMESVFAALVERGHVAGERVA